jgi:hypothetical protein
MNGDIKCADIYHLMLGFYQTNYREIIFMMHENKEDKSGNARIHELSEMIGEDEINRWAKWNIVRKVISLILSMLLLLTVFFHTFDNDALLALHIITLALLFSFEFKENRKRRNLSFAKIVINGQTKLLQPSGTELSYIKYKIDEALNWLLIWKNATRFDNTFYAFFDVITKSLLLPISIAFGIFLAHSMLSTLLDLTIPLDWAYNSQTLIIPTLTMLLLAASFYEAKLSKPIHKKILSLKW